MKSIGRVALVALGAFFAATSAQAWPDRPIKAYIPFGAGSATDIIPRTVFDALSQLIRAAKLTVLIATHNMDIARRMDRRVTIRDGLVIELQ